MEDTQLFESRIELSGLQEKVGLLKEEIGRVVIGQYNFVELLLTALLTDGHVLIEGVPGVAKTLMAKVMAHLTDVDFKRIQFTPDLMPSDILGTSVFNPSSGKFDYHKGPVFTNILLTDEINRAPAKTQAALFEVMEERQVTNDGEVYLMEEPFMVIATQNPIEHEGTYRLPEAQLDRFLFKITVGYPTFEEEVEILDLHEQNSGKLWERVSPVLSREELNALRNKISDVQIDEKLKKYIVNIVSQTRKNSWLFLGASPRASIAMMNAGKTFAALQGRDFVIPEDIITITYPVLRHRIQLSAEKELEGITVDQAIEQVLSQIEVPR